jgi:hypothetical protein
LTHHWISLTESQTIPWKTITVEAVAIVVSILLAFAIDAWWAEKKEGEVEHVALQALRADFLASREQLEVVVRSLESARTDFDRFQSATTAELIEIDSDTTRYFLTALSKNHTFDPVTSTLDALVNDGRLGLISDDQLLEQLSDWRRKLDNIEDISSELRNESVRVRRAMEQHGGPFTRWRRGPSNLEVLPTADGETMANLQRDVAFMGTARSHQYALSVYLWELQQLAENLDSVLSLLDQATSNH